MACDSASALCARACTDAMLALEVDALSIFTVLRNVYSTFLFVFTLFPIVESEDSFGLLLRKVTPETRVHPLSYILANC